jgi:hypothetical protein
VVQIVENWANVTGRIVAIGATAAAAGHTPIIVQIEQARPVSGFVNLLAESAGETIIVNIRDATAERFDITPGALFSGLVRRHGLSTWYAHPEEIRITPPSAGDA